MSALSDLSKKWREQAIEYLRIGTPYLRVRGETLQQASTELEKALRRDGVFMSFACDGDSARYLLGDLEPRPSGADRPSGTRTPERV